MDNYLILDENNNIVSIRVLETGFFNNPKFKYVKTNLNNKALLFLSRNLSDFYYDFNLNSVVAKNSGQLLDSTFAIPAKKEYNSWRLTDDFFIKEVLNVNNHIENQCDFLCQALYVNWDRDILEERKYWLDFYFTYRTLSGVDYLRWAIAYGRNSDIIFGYAIMPEDNYHVFLRDTRLTKNDYKNLEKHIEFARRLKNVLRDYNTGQNSEI